ncbi:Ribosomal protein L11 domain protein [Dictyocaulus viviparus]|uniref:Large ribosomal subunit protein uL11m n=1 Tax=Dictyocaulus viviparus TaxID=29172 RepID=A0A0D8Y169_DICVI|nr:Ribosomal protein L11 domain protein [Dictyocaulus viviparus]
MASKTIARVRKKEVVKVIHGPLLKVIIRAQMASAAPPLGSQLGQRGLNVANFCKEFNKETGHIKPGTPLPTRISIKPDRTYDLEICSPTTSWLLKTAAGIARGKQNKGMFHNSLFYEIAGKLSVKHIYEIAMVKSQDKCLQGVPLQMICRQIIKQCRTIGIQVQKEDLDPVELKKFLDERRKIVAEQLKEFADKKAAKMLRTA